MDNKGYVMDVEVENPYPQKLQPTLQPTPENFDVSRFDRVYQKLGDSLKLERKRIDYVLVHPKKTSEEEEDEDDKRILIRQEHLRSVFEKALRMEGFYIHQQVIGSNVYKKLHCPFKRLCREAEKTNLEMPIDPSKTDTTAKKKKKPQDLEQQKQKQCCGSLRERLTRIFEPEETIDYESTPFMMDRVHIFKDFKDPSNFFRPALRSLLVRHILINLNIRDQLKKSLIDEDDEINDYETEGVACDCTGDEVETPADRQKRKALQKIAFPYLQLKGVYTDSLILHDASNRSSKKEDLDKKAAELKTRKDDTESKLTEDPRADLDDIWTKFYKFQPLHKIRNYFGEKIAFYFAWCGLLIETLWVPMLFGIAVFIYGLYLSIKRSGEDPVQSSSTNTTVAPKSLVSDLLDVIKTSFDNEVTPYFALIICVWGTLFLELWKRKCNRLAYTWDVQEFEANEPDRPEFFGTTTRTDPVTGENAWYFPLRRQMMRFSLSCMTMTFMVCLVLTSVLSVIIYRVISSVDYCPNMSAAGCLMTTTVVSSILNTVSILILGKIYDWLAVKLTDLENHRTQTMYDDALIVKLFAFQFANNYASCFYIAFFRGRFDYTGILRLGAEYRDDCEGTCMSQLSFQILTLMIAKPLPKLFSDVILPWFKRLWRNRPDCMRCCKSNEVGDEEDLAYKASKYPHKLDFLEKELLKDKLGDFTVGEYTEKVIQYGFLMLFAASFPLAPLLALLLLVFDIRVDAKRMLWWYRRPVATVAQDIGTWFIILQFVNFAGVVSNGFLIAFTSAWGQQFSTKDQLWIVVGFEHIVFMLKFLVAYIIPDIPDDVALAMRRRTHRLTKILNDDRKEEADELRALIKKSMESCEPAHRDYTEKSDDTDWYPKQQNYRGSPLMPRATREEKQQMEDDGDVNRVKKLKKHKKKKKRSHHLEDEESQLVNQGHDYLNYEMKDQVRPRPHKRRSLEKIQHGKLPGQLSFKVRGPHGEELAELPVKDIKHSTDRYHDSAA